MKIVQRVNGHYFRTCCCLCGFSFEMGDSMAYAFNDDDDTSDRSKGGDVCEECVAAGEEGIKNRVREKAKRAQSIADQDALFAKELESERIQLPNPAEIELEIDRMYVDRFGKTREQLEAENPSDVGCPF